MKIVKVVRTGFGLLDSSKNESLVSRSIKHVYVEHYIAPISSIRLGDKTKDIHGYIKWTLNGLLVPGWGFEVSARHNTCCKLLYCCWINLMWHNWGERYVFGHHWTTCRCPFIRYLQNRIEPGGIEWPAAWPIKTTLRAEKLQKYYG